MSKYPFDITFRNLRDACIARAPTFRNAKGELNNSSDWSPSDKIVSIVGELGEAANIIKKVRRGDFGLDDRPPEFKGCTVREAIGKELADTVTYIEHLATKLDIDLGEAVFDKFNEISARVGSPIVLAGSDYDSESKRFCAFVVDQRDQLGGE
jgi:NTP pyrophosphatase (non-canonical NTP hydrolase)